MKILKEMRNAIDEYREAFHHDGDPEVCDDRNPELPDRGKGTFFERASEVRLAGVVCEGSPRFVGRVDRFEDATPLLPDGGVADPQPPLNRNTRTPSTWTLR